MSGGSGEQALLTAACAQMAHYYDLAGGVPAGMSDSKVPDAQAGLEKGYTNAIAGLAGANMVYESAGMHASLLGCCFESFVIDNDLLGSAMRTVRGIEVTEDSLSLEAMRQVCLEGPNHYLGHEQTLSLMQSEYIYPEVGDRTSPKEWIEQGSTDVRVKAREKVQDNAGQALSQAHLGRAGRRDPLALQHLPAAPGHAARQRSLVGTVTDGPWLALYRDRVRAEWIDYNGHMSEAYYVLVFGFATDALLDHIGLGQAERQRARTSAYTVEAHIHYLSEVGEGAPLEVRTRLLALDAKRVRVFHALHHGTAGSLLATEELMLLHVDTSGPRTAPFAPAVFARLQEIHEGQKSTPWPKQAGRAIGQGR